MTKEFTIPERRAEPIGRSYVITVERCQSLAVESPVELQAYISSDNQLEQSKCKSRTSELMEHVFEKP